MRALYIDEGNDPDYAACAKHQIDTLCFSLRDPKVTRPYLEKHRARGYGVSVFAAWNWPGYEGTGREFAEKVAAGVDALHGEAAVATTFPRVILNDETQDAVRIIDLVVRWRELYRYQATSWSLEGMQGGWQDADLVEAIAKARVRVSPQAYLGSMERICEDALLRDLTKRGYPEAAITPTYDAAQLGHWWSGWAFTQGRLPA